MGRTISYRITNGEVLRFCAGHAPVHVRVLGSRAPRRPPANTWAFADAVPRWALDAFPGRGCAFAGCGCARDRWVVLLVDGRYEAVPSCGHHSIAEIRSGP
ncbi:MAG: hypothetical protein WA688_09350 [Thermoplasmata archaeon]